MQRFKFSLAAVAVKASVVGRQAALCSH